MSKKGALRGSPVKLPKKKYGRLWKLRDFRVTRKKGLISYETCAKLKPTMISVGILELMWVWNDYLLPYLVLDRTKYMTIPIHVQYLKGSYGSVDLGATMAVIMLSIIPIILVYMFCQKQIIKGVAAGAVKG